MPHYHFDLQNSGERIDALGGVMLDDDGEALAFGRRVIRELLDKNPEQHARWTMEITDGERTVHSIPLELECCSSGAAAPGRSDKNVVITGPQPVH